MRLATACIRHEFQMLKCRPTGIRAQTMLVDRVLKLVEKL